MVASASPSFPLLPLRGRPLGPRLSGVLWSLRPGGRIRFAAGRSGHGSALTSSTEIGSRLIAERDFSRSCRFAAGRSGHGSATDLFTRPDRALLRSLLDPVAADGDYGQQQQECPGAGEYGEHGHINDRGLDRSLPAGVARNVCERHRRCRFRPDILGRWFQPCSVRLERRELQEGGEEDCEQRDDERPGQRRPSMSGHSEAVCGLLDVGGVQGWVFAHIICVTDGAVGLVAGSAK